MNAKAQSSNVVTPREDRLVSGVIDLPAPRSDETNGALARRRRHQVEVENETARAAIGANQISIGAAPRADHQIEAKYQTVRTACGPYEDKAAHEARKDAIDDSSGGRGSRRAGFPRSRWRENGWHWRLASVLVYIRKLRTDAASRNPLLLGKLFQAGGALARRRRHPAGFSQSRWRRRAAFTLIELMVVILIIGLLASLLLVAFGGGRQQAQRTRQVNEITQLALALDAFKSQYGAYPPSRIRLREGTAYRARGATADPFDVMSVQWLKKLWPQIAITIVDGTQSEPVNITSASPAAQEWFIWCQDDTGNNETETNRRARSGYTPQTYELEGDECLVFFLGGIASIQNGNRTDTTQTVVLNGFSKSPRNPAQLPDPAFPDTIQRDRFYDFNAGNLYFRQGAQVQVRDNTNFAQEFPSPAAGAAYRETNVDFTFPSYRPIGSTPESPPVAYFSSYGGQGYRPDDFNYPPETDAPNNVDRIHFQIVWPTMTREPTAAPTYSESLGPNPYTRSRAAPISNIANTTIQPRTETNQGINLETATLDTARVVQPFLPDTFQIIAPGRDNAYGPGGQLGRFSMQPTDPSGDNLSNVTGGQTVLDFNEAQRAK